MNKVCYNISVNRKIQEITKSWQNKKQLKKNLSSDKNLERPIKILKYINIKKIFLEVIKELSKNKYQKIMIF